MQVTKIPADIVKDEEMEYLKDANERQTRLFVAIIANRHGRHGVSLVCGILGIDRKTVYRGRHELPYSLAFSSVVYTKRRFGINVSSTFFCLPFTVL